MPVRAAAAILPALTVPELKVETQFQNSGTWLSRRAKGLVAAAGAVHQKKATPEDPKLQPLSFTQLFRHHRRHSSSRSSTLRSLFASPSCSVHLDRHFDHPQSLTRLFPYCTTRPSFSPETGAHTSNFETLEHSPNPTSTTPPSPPQIRRLGRNSSLLPSWKH